MSDHTDEQLAVAAQEGEASAFEELLHRHERAVYSLCRMILCDRHDASDATQEAFLKAYRNLCRYDRKRCFSSWLMTIAARICHDMREKKKPKSSGDTIDELASPPSDPSAILSDREDVARVRAAIESLPGREREAIALFVVKELSAAEVAEALDITTGNLGVILFRAKARLRAMLRGPGR